MRKNVHKMNKPLSRLTLVLHDIRSVYNVGAMFRTAEAFGVGKIFLSGYTPAPFDRFGRVRNDFKKSALGAEEGLAWESFPDAISVVERLSKDGVQIISLEQSEHSVDIRTAEVTGYIDTQTALVVGNEVHGIPPELLEASASVIEIPQFGKKESLNVSVALGVVLYHFVFVSSSSS